MKTYIKFTKSITLNTISDLDGRIRQLYFPADVKFEVEHIKEFNNNHISVWLKDEGVIIPHLFNDMTVLMIYKK